MHPRQPPSRIARHAAQRSPPNRFPLKCYPHVGKTHDSSSPHLSTQPVLSFKQPDSTFLSSTVDHILPPQPHHAPEDPARRIPSDEIPNELSASSTFHIPRLPQPSLLLATPSFQALQSSASVTSISSTAPIFGGHSPIIRCLEPYELELLDHTIPELSLSVDSDSSVGSGSPGPEDFLELYQVLSSYCNTPTTSVPSSPTSTRARNSLLTPPSRDDLPISSSWGSVEDVSDMLAQLEKVASDLRMMDTHQETKSSPSYLTPTSFPPSFDDDISSCAGRNVYSSSNASQAHSLAYLKDDSSFIEREEFSHYDVPKIIITAPSTENLLSRGHDSFWDSDEVLHMFKGSNQSEGWLSPESAKDLSRLGSYGRRDTSSASRSSSLRPLSYTYTPPSQLLSRPRPQLPTVSCLELTNDSSIPPTPLPPMTFMPGPFSEESSDDDARIDAPYQRDDCTSTRHAALLVCKLISEPIVHYSSKKRLKDKRVTLSTPSLRASHSLSTSPSLDISEIRALLENSYGGDGSLDSSTSSTQLHAQPTVSAPSPLRKSLTTCWSEESIVSPRKPSRWKALKRIFKRKK